MIQESFIYALISQWKERAAHCNSEDYKCALGECAYDLQQLLDESLDYQDYFNQYMVSLPSKEVEDYLAQQEADDVLSTIESHEPAA